MKSAVGNDEEEILLISDNCEWLHEQLEKLPLYSYPFQINQLPNNGIYFFYEKDEIWGHGGLKPRIVRVGTHKNGNFRNRISEHFLLDEARMNFTEENPAPHDRSIFRKNIGRALLNRDKNGYLYVWEIDFTTHSSREEHRQLRNIMVEKVIENAITKILRENFSFRFIVMDNQDERMGTKGLESSLIGTLARCSKCVPSSTWLGKGSPKKEIRENGLWLVQHISSPEITPDERKVISAAIEKTQKWISSLKNKDNSDIIII